MSGHRAKFVKTCVQHLLHVQSFNMYVAATRSQSEFPRCVFGFEVYKNFLGKVSNCRGQAACAINIKSFLK